MGSGNELYTVDDLKEGYAAEREDLSMDWVDYICYILEVDKEKMNQDELLHLSAVVADACIGGDGSE